jgi:hypothetical protein
MKTIFVSLSCLFFCTVSFGQQAKIIKYLELLPPDGWIETGRDDTPDSDSLIALALAGKDDDYKIDSINNTADFSEYGNFVVYSARDGKDLFVEYAKAARWIDETTFWQYDPAKNSLKEVTKYFAKKTPSIKSFFPNHFSFKGKDTTQDEVRVAIAPEKDSLEYSLSCDPMSDHPWLYTKATPPYEWIATWNGVSFTWKRIEAEEQ